MYRSLFARDMFNELDRLQRQMDPLFAFSPSIRGSARGSYPALNVGLTPAAVDVYAFAPGLDPSTIDVTLDRGVLSLAGERRSGAPTSDGKTTLHLQERFNGRFRRVVSLPDDIDPTAVVADYRDGVLHVNVKRKEAAQPRRIEVQ